MTAEPVNIIVLTYNRIKYFKVFIESLYLSTQYPFRLIVIDNGSIDGTRKFILDLEKQGRVWKHLFTEENLPLAAAFTKALPLVESEFVVTVADDLTPPPLKTPCWLTLFVAKMRSDENIGSINLVGALSSYDSYMRKMEPYVRR